LNHKIVEVGGKEGREKMRNRICEFKQSKCYVFINSD